MNISRTSYCQLEKRLGENLKLAQVNSQEYTGFHHCYPSPNWKIGTIILSLFLLVGSGVVLSRPSVSETLFSLPGAPLYGALAGLMFWALGLGYIAIHGMINLWSHLGHSLSTSVHITPSRLLFVHRDQLYICSLEGWEKWEKEVAPGGKEVLSLFFQNGKKVTLPEFPKEVGAVLAEILTAVEKVGQEESNEKKHDLLKESVPWSGEDRRTTYLHEDEAYSQLGELESSPSLPELKTHYKGMSYAASIFLAVSLVLGLVYLHDVRQLDSVQTVKEIEGFLQTSHWPSIREEAREKLATRYLSQLDKYKDLPRELRVVHTAPQVPGWSDDQNKELEKKLVAKREEYLEEYNQKLIARYHEKVGESMARKWMTNWIKFIRKGSAKPVVSLKVITIHKKANSDFWKKWKKVRIVDLKCKLPKNSTSVVIGVARQVNQPVPQEKMFYSDERLWSSSSYETWSEEVMKGMEDHLKKHFPHIEVGASTSAHITVRMEVSPRPFFVHPDRNGYYFPINPRRVAQILASRGIDSRSRKPVLPKDRKKWGDYVLALFMARTPQSIVQYQREYLPGYSLVIDIEGKLPGGGKYFARDVVILPREFTLLPFWCFSRREYVREVFRSLIFFSLKQAQTKAYRRLGLVR